MSAKPDELTVIRRRAYLNEYRRKRKASGQCWLCGSSLDRSPSTGTCLPCFEKERERLRVVAQELRARRMEQGVCVTCGDNPIHQELTVYCLACAVRARELKREKRGCFERNYGNKTYRLEAEQCSL